MEYCSNGQLYELINLQPNKFLHEKHCKFFASEILIGLQYLHLRGYIYRDIKPENILIDKFGHILLTDFDLSFISGCTPTLEIIKNNHNNHHNHNKNPNGDTVIYHLEPNNNRTNSFVGTEEYVAPEIIEGKGYTSTVDWWSFGILLFELCFGKTPFKGSTRTETFENIIKGDLHFPITQNISDEFKDLLTKLLIKIPNKRLGGTNGAEEIKEHPFFKDINWALIRNSRTPFHRIYKRRSRETSRENSKFPEY
jgi:protein-serine/threonine kinase